MGLGQAGSLADPSSPCFSILGVCVGHTEQQLVRVPTCYSSLLPSRPCTSPTPAWGPTGCLGGAGRGRPRMGPGWAVSVARDAELAWVQVFRKLSEGGRTFQSICP